MKLATKKNGTRDGLLMVVSKDLTQCVPATEIFHAMHLAPTMQVALDNWDKDLMSYCLVLYLECLADWQ